MDRHCPNCKTELGGYDRFFCSSCGVALEESLVIRDNFNKRVANFAAVSKESSKSGPKSISSSESRFSLNLFNIQHVISMIVIVLFIGSAVFVFKNNLFKGFNFKINSKPLKIIEPKKVVATENIIENELSWQAGKLGTANFMESVPFDAEIVIEGKDLKNFLNSVTKVFPEYSALSEYFSEGDVTHFVLFALPSGNVTSDDVASQSIDNSTIEDVTHQKWSLILFPVESDLSITQEILAKYPDIKVWKNDPIILLTTETKIVESVTETKAGLAKNFSHTPVYASYKSKIPESARGLVFVTSRGARELLKEIPNSDNMPDDVRLVIEKLINNESEFSIIR